MKLFLIGGFLGSGKTTAIVSACQLLAKQNKKVAVITNDQGNQQVDHLYVKSFGIATREVANGCFCCQYDQLDAHLQSLHEQDHPDVIFAESVGSCTDLIATIVKPLSKLKPGIETVVSVFTDAELLASLIEERSSFLEESVRYIYKKQLEEADLLVINKIDRLSSEQLAAAVAVIQSQYPGKIVLQQNSFAEYDISRWLAIMEQFTQNVKRNSLEIDYDVYGEGESRLAWLDKSTTIYAPYDNGVFIAHSIIKTIFDNLQMARFTIGHLKFFLETESWNEKISFTTTSTGANIKAENRKAKTVNMLINARVQTGPGDLEKLIDEALVKAERVHGCTIVTGKWSVFKPGYPRPAHRVA